MRKSDKPLKCEDIHDRYLSCDVTYHLMIHKTSILLLLAFLAFVDSAKCQFQFEAYALHQVHLVDVNQGLLLENRTVVIKGDQIVGIYDSNEFNRSDTIQILDFKDHFVTPGLIDAHVHLGTNPSRGDNFEDTRKRLEHLLLNGVTTVRDMAGDARYLNYLSRQASLDEITSPDIYFSALFAGESFFKDPRTKAAAQGRPAGESPWMRSITTGTDMDRAIAEARGTGATGIKIYADLDAVNVRRIVKAAHTQKMKVWAHATVFPARPSEVCRAGVDVMSHATYLAWEGEENVPSDASFRLRKHERFDAGNRVFLDLVRSMKANEIILDATVALYKKYFPDSTLYHYGISLTKLAYENDVDVGVGTDMSIDLTSAAPIFREMMALQEDVDMKPIDIIRAATIVNAKMIGQESNMGSIEPGKKANLLILNNDPTKDISHLQAPKVVIKNGKLYNSN